jgi:hypothetical protein
MALFAASVVYLLDAFVYANKVVSGVDLYEDGSWYFTVSYAVRLAVILALIHVIRKKTRILKATPGGLQGGIPFLRLEIGAIAVVALGYLVNGFQLKYALRDCVIVVFPLVLLHAVILDLFHDRGKCRKALRSYLRALFFFHVAGLLFLLWLNFDSAFILKKITLESLEFTVYDESRLHFFSLAGNEEAYTVLTLGLIAAFDIPGFVRWLGLVIMIPFLVLLGTRTTMLLCIMFAVLAPLIMLPRKMLRYLVFAAISGALVAYYSVLESKAVLMFDFVKGKDLFAIALEAFQDDTLGWRFQAMWIPIIASMAGGPAILVGITSQGIVAFGLAQGEDFTAIHNAFLYFFVTTGMVGLAYYASGYFLALKSWRHWDIKSVADDQNRLGYAFALVTLFVYSLMNNSYSVQGMILYVLVIGVGYSSQMNERDVAR